MKSRPSMLVGDLVLFREQCIAIFSRRTRRRQFSHVTHAVKITMIRVVQTLTVLPVEAAAAAGEEEADGTEYGFA